MAHPHHTKAHQATYNSVWDGARPAEEVIQQTKGGVFSRLFQPTKSTARNHRPSPSNTPGPEDSVHSSPRSQKSRSLNHLYMYEAHAHAKQQCHTAVPQLPALPANKLAHNSKTAVTSPHHGSLVATSKHMAVQCEQQSSDEDVAAYVVINARKPQQQQYKPHDRQQHNFKCCYHGEQTLVPTTPSSYATAASTTADPGRTAGSLPHTFPAHQHKASCTSVSSAALAPIRTKSTVPTDPVWEDFTPRGQIITFISKHMPGQHDEAAPARSEQAAPQGTGLAQQQNGTVLKFEVLGVFNAGSKAELYHVRLLHDVLEGSSAAGEEQQACGTADSGAIVYRTGQEFALKRGSRQFRVGTPGLYYTTSCSTQCAD